MPSDNKNKYPDIGYLEVSPNNRSLGRLLALLGFCISSMVIIVGCVVFVYSTVFSSGSYASQALAVIGLGTAGIGATDLLKASQKKQETRNGQQ